MPRGERPFMVNPGGIGSGTSIFFFVSVSTSTRIG